MTFNTKRLLCFALAVTAFLVATPSRTGAQAGTSMEIVIGNGPHAGTYKLSAGKTTCLYVKTDKQFSAAYKDVGANDPKRVSGVGINVFNPDDPGPKQGQVNIRFGDPDGKRPAPYVVVIPRDSKGPLGLTRSGQAATLTFQGQTKSGIDLQVTAMCAQVVEF